MTKKDYIRIAAALHRCKPAQTNPYPDAFPCSMWCTMKHVIDIMYHVLLVLLSAFAGCVFFYTLCVP